MMPIRKLSKKEISTNNLQELRNSIKRELLINDATLNEELVNTLKEMQTEEGYFELCDTDGMPSDVFVEYIHFTSMMIISYLITKFLKNESKDESKDLLKKALEYLSKNIRRGHGYESFRNQLETIELLLDNNIIELITSYGKIYPKLRNAIKREVNYYRKMLLKGNTKGIWGEDYADRIKNIVSRTENFDIKVFVYGTLMKGESNHYLLHESRRTYKASLKNYNIYNLGFFPAIKEGNGIVKGEVYSVNKMQLDKIDYLESEGELYKRKLILVQTSRGIEIPVYTYEYINNIDKDKIMNNYVSSWKNNEEYVYYVSYGSNMLKKRFMLYINGGEDKKLNIRQKGCNNKQAPLESFSYTINYDMYFAKNAPKWNYEGVSFLDLSKQGKSHGRAYLITKQQFDEIALQEGGAWYNKRKKLGVLNGLDVVTFTSTNKLSPVVPSEKYKEALLKGLVEIMGRDKKEDIIKYIQKCVG